MIAELGHFALVLALVVAFLQGTLPLWGAARRQAPLVELAPAAALLQFTLVTLAFLALLNAHLASDFSLAIVYQNSHSTKPLLYKFSGVWGNHEGSLVLWVWILALFGAAVALFGRNLPRPFKARVLAVQGLIGLGFLAFSLFTSNPFARLDPAPLDGLGLNPILQDPGLAFHPPMLYLGYVGFSTAYSFAMAALIEGRVDASWARWVRPWTLAAWMALTLGIALGSWWAYYTLGWGGFWFWDPVENASFMPWLAGTALLHSAIVVEKRDTLKSWTILLAILTFSLALLGTFLVRSGVLTSVHAFATDPSRGVFVLALLGIAVGGSLALYAWRAPALQGGGAFAPISREGALLLNNLLLATATATVLLGTLYPLLLDGLGGPKISVGPPFFNATFLPLMVPLLVALPAGSMIAWKRGDLSGVLSRLGLAAAGTVAVLLAAALLADTRSTLGLMGFAAGAWVLLGSLNELAVRAGFFQVPPARAWRRLKGLPRSAFSMSLAHMGLGVLILGITATATGQTERILAMRPGETVTLAGYEVTLASVEQVQGPNYVARSGTFAVQRDGAPVTTVRSEKRFFPVESMPVTKPGIHSTLLRDLYFVLGDPNSEGAWAVRLYHNPLVFWMWGGAGLMGLAGLVSLTDRRLRVGAPVPARGSRAAAA
ncbi:heme lyase CcmF/NrfE family subunit [Geminicoccaceae bacterium 1502E]|nr:heme lyase CcmF/NrfE family subunit [Geminicoccaceae bacterium 1502E]